MLSLGQLSPHRRPLLWDGGRQRSRTELEINFGWRKWPPGLAIGRAVLISDCTVQTETRLAASNSRPRQWRAQHPPGQRLLLPLEKRPSQTSPCSTLAVEDAQSTGTPGGDTARR